MIAGNLFFELMSRLRGGPCTPMLPEGGGVLKLREYLAVPSILHHVLIEHDGGGLPVHTRDGVAWATVPFVEGETLPIPAAGIDVPVAAIYAGVTFEQARRATLQPGPAPVL